jgi:uncharacterized protein
MPGTRGSLAYRRGLRHSLPAIERQGSWEVRGVANSLQEQLLKAGLVSQQKAKQTKTEKRKDAKSRGQTPDPAAEERRRRAEQVQAEKAQRDRALNRERQEAAQRAALANELRQLIHAHRVTRDRGELAFNFADGKALKRIYVTPEQQRGLADGRLAVVRQDHFYELLPSEIADKVFARDPDLVVVDNRRQAKPAAASPKSETEDPYAGYQVPDDLVW